MLSSDKILAGKILIVDDQPVNIILIERILRDAGYLFITSTMNSRAVCELHRKHRYDLIMLDMQMPGMDGLQVMEALKDIEVGSYLPVLVLTAQPDHRLPALQAGAKDFISKPFEISEVLIRVANMLEVSMLHMETKRLYEQLMAEKGHAERLLLNVIPQPISQHLK